MFKKWFHHFLNKTQSTHCKQQQAEARQAQHADQQSVEQVEPQLKPRGQAAQQPQGPEAQGRVACHPEDQLQGASGQAQHPQQHKQSPHAQGELF